MKITVGISDMKISSQPDDTIVTYALGSCLAVAVHDPAVKVGGMLHVLLPSASVRPDKAQGNPYMFVDTGMQAFLSNLAGVGALRRRWQLYVAGGATFNRSDIFDTGRRNYVALKSFLWRSGLLVHAEDVGGNSPRTMHLEVGTGRVWLSNGAEQWDLRVKSQSRAVPGDTISCQ